MSPKRYEDINLLSVKYRILNGKIKIPELLQGSVSKVNTSMLVLVENPVNIYWIKWD